ncbi:MAG: CDP-diacylglycerol--serine O-phosphatidyltransferase, partial [Syntrophomonadaceae bacterium]|nr:CDP-diacylglycerol--serine O-phosphatidyltransferase [Syntrophomonadaceae bacterium]
APAFLIYALLPASYQTPAAILTVLYIVCGAYRLARFNVLRSEGYFIGVPITLAGLLLAVLALCEAFIPSLIMLLTLPVLAFFMASNIRVKKP